MATYQIVCVWANPESKELRKDVVFADSVPAAFDRSDLNKHFRRDGFVEWQALGRPSWSMARHADMWKRAGWKPASVWRVHGMQLQLNEKQEGLLPVERRGLASGEMPF